jgi:hypothetical protein
LRGCTNSATSRSRSEISAGKPSFYDKAVATDDRAVATDDLTGENSIHAPVLAGTGWRLRLLHQQFSPHRPQQA